VVVAERNLGIAVSSKEAAGHLHRPYWQLRDYLFGYYSMVVQNKKAPVMRLLYINYLLTGVNQPHLSSVSPLNRPKKAFWISSVIGPRQPSPTKAECTG
jgi:hypothetical protein